MWDSINALQFSALSGLCRKKHQSFGVWIFTICLPSAKSTLSADAIVTTAVAVMHCSFAVRNWLIFSKHAEDSASISICTTILYNII